MIKLIKVINFYLFAILVLALSGVGCNRAVRISADCLTCTDRQTAEFRHFAPVTALPATEIYGREHVG
jgi:hypothetical protein